MSFVQRQLTFSISLANGNFAGGGNAANLTGLRATAKITNAGPPSQGILSAEIFGLPLSMMNQLTTLGTQTNLVGQNTITVQAGDAFSGMTTVFMGYIDIAFANIQAQPQASFHIEAHAASLPAVKPMDATSVEGSADAAQIAGQLAQKMGYQFENNGVQAKLSNPYLWGSGISQMHLLSKGAGFGYVIENGTLAIFPQGMPRQGGAALISADTGMVGYPAFNSAGIVVRVLFNPSLGLKMQGQITVQSDITPACGTWTIVNLEYDLASQVPRGSWYAIANAIRTGSM